MLLVVAEQRILKGTTPTLVSYPRVRPDRLAQGQPTSVSVRVSAPAATDAAFVSATFDSLSTTVTTAAEEGDDSLAIASANIDEGRRYLVSAPGRNLIVEARVGGAGSTTLYLTSPLPCDVPDDATVKGFAVSFQLSSAQTAQVGEAAVLWRATVDGATLQWSQLFRIVSRLPTALLTYSELVQAYPSVVGLLPADVVGRDVTISAAWNHKVVPLLEAKGAFAEDVVSDEALVPLHALAVLWHLVEFSQTVTDQFRESVKASWNEAISTTFARVSWSEADQTEEPPAPRVPDEEPVRGRMRLSR